MSGIDTDNKRLRICYLSASSGDWGGASRVLYTTLRLIDTARIEPLVLLPDNGPIVSDLDAMGIRHVIWGKTHELNGLRDYSRDIISAFRFFRENRIDILHINNASYWRPAEIVAARLARVPVITHYHVVVEKPGPYVRFSDRIIAVSEFVAKHSLPDKVRKEVIHNCVRLQRFDQARDLRKELGYSDTDIVVSFIGQIRRIKGIEAFLTIARDIDEANAKFLIAGKCRDPEIFTDSYSEKQLTNAVAETGNIQYVGYRSDVENIYMTSDIIVVPSYWDEPFGLINIEAGATSRPVVASRVGGIPEVIRHGENGFLYERDNTDELGNFVRILIADKKLREKMGRHARTIVEQDFTDKPVRKLEYIYESVAGKH